MARKIGFALCLLLIVQQGTSADDWKRFRGPLGSGVSSDQLPVGWSPNANLKWKAEMPGPGASSPIVIGNKVFLTCYSGYGLDRNEPGDINKLMRHLVCIDLKTGKKLWQKDIKAALPEDPYTGIGVTAHGYASHTPVTDGTNVYAFFGKGGVHAFTLDGKKLWEAFVGKESDPAKWGSSSSPVVFKDTVIVTASAESQSIIGLDKKSGKELWRQEASGLDGMWGTPALVKVDDSRTDLVMCVAKEIWGLNPENGKMRWFAKATDSQQAYSSVIPEGKRVYAVTGRGGGSVAIDVGGSGDVSESHTAWVGRENASFASPVLHKGKIYVVASRILKVIDSESGKLVKQFRLKGAKQTGGRFGSLDYPSPIVAGDKLYYLNGSGQMYVFDIAGDIKQIALNQVTTDTETFWGSPAVADGNLIMRSSKYLYCVADKGEKAETDSKLLSKADDGQSEPKGAIRGGGRGGRGGGSTPRFDPNAMFNNMDKNKDDKVTFGELEGNQMAARLKTLDKDGDEAISKEEFTTGISSLFSRGGNRGGRGRGGQGYGRGGADNRPKRPQRPQMEGK